jgi:hypothetical protein
MSALPPKAPVERTSVDVSKVPATDHGSLSRTSIREEREVRFGQARQATPRTSRATPDGKPPAPFALEVDTGVLLRKHADAQS